MKAKDEDQTMRSCSWFSGSTILKCAIAPESPCLDCGHYELKAGYVDTPAPIPTPVPLIPLFPDDRPTPPRSSRRLYSIEILGFGSIQGEILEFDRAFEAEHRRRQIQHELIDGLRGGLHGCLPFTHPWPTHQIAFILGMRPDRSFSDNVYNPRDLHSRRVDFVWRTETHRIFVRHCELSLDRAMRDEIRYRVRGEYLEIRAIAEANNA